MCHSEDRCERANRDANRDETEMQTEMGMCVSAQVSTQSAAVLVLAMSGGTSKAQTAAKTWNLCLASLVDHPQCGPKLVQKAKDAKPGQARRAALTPEQRTWAFNFVKNIMWNRIGEDLRRRLMAIAEGGSRGASKIEFSSDEVDTIRGAGLRPWCKAYVYPSLGIAL